MKKVNLIANGKKLSLNKVTISKLDAQKIKGGKVEIPTLTNSSAECLTLRCSDFGCNPDS